MYPELKTEEGYSADIHISLEIYVREHSENIYLQRYMSALYPSSVFTSGNCLTISEQIYSKVLSILQGLSNIVLGILGAVYLQPDRSKLSSV